MKKINKFLYCCKCECLNFGDELNKYLFEKVFDVRFNYCFDPWQADYLAIGSILDNCSSVKLSGFLSKIKLIIKLFLGKINFSKITVLGSGFQYWSNEHKIKYLRKMDFRIVRGKLTENYLRNNGLLKNDVLLGDLGLLCPYMLKEKVEKKYKLGIIPHYVDLNSPVVYDIYKKHRKNCIIINVQDDVDVVIKQIAECENIIASSLHGLIVADSFNVPNLWFENTLNLRVLDRFKYNDYYSIYGIDEIEPVNILDVADIDINTIAKSYCVKKELVEKKQKELYEFCKEYFEKLVCSKN